MQCPFTYFVCEEDKQLFQANQHNNVNLFCFETLFGNTIQYKTQYKTVASRQRTPGHRWIFFDAVKRAKLT